MHTEFPKLPSATNYCELVMGQPRTVIELILKESGLTGECFSIVNTTVPQGPWLVESTNAETVDTEGQL